MSNHLVTLSIHIPDSRHPENHSADFIKETLEEGIEVLLECQSSCDCMPWEAWEVTVDAIQSEESWGISQE